MNNILGPKRILLLLSLLALNALLGGVLYFYLLPQKARDTNLLSDTKFQVNQIRSDLDYARQEMEALETKGIYFNQLRTRGFFSLQKRQEAENILEKIQKQSQVISASAKIGAGEIIHSDAAAKAEYVLLVSPVELSVDALYDVAIYNYIYMLRNYFPGHLSIEEIIMERKAEVTGDILRSIAGGNNPIMMSARIKMKWETMIPKTSVIEEEGQVQ